MRPTSCPCVGGRYLPVASKCRTSRPPEARWNRTAEVAGDHRVGGSWREGSARVPVASRSGCTGRSARAGACARALRSVAGRRSAGGAAHRHPDSAGPPHRPSSRAPVALEARRNSVHRCTSSTSSMASAARARAREGAQEAAVGLVLPRHRALTAPAGAAQRVEAAVVAGAGVRVRLDVALVGQGVLGEHRPGQRRRRVGGGDLARVEPAGQGARRRGPRAGASAGCRAGRSSRGASRVGACVVAWSRVGNTPREVALARRVLHPRPLGSRARRVSPGGCPPSAGSGRPRRCGRPCRPRPPCPRRAGRTASCCRPRRRSSARRCSSSASSRRPGG